jgi:plasmid maintenance system antidote protein VapI
LIGRLSGEALAMTRRRQGPETAWLLASALNTTPEFWVNLQAACDLARSRPAQPVERLAAAG